MAEVRKAVQQVSRAGLAPTYHADLTTSDTFLVNNDGRVLLHAKKASAVDCVVTIATPGTVDGQAVADRTVTVPASGGDRFIGPFSVKDYNDSGGDLRLTFSNIAGLTLAVLRV
jgi:hypothetical protein